jgi:hypothetical protein
MDELLMKNVLFKAMRDKRLDPPMVGVFTLALAQTNRYRFKTSTVLSKAAEEKRDFVIQTLKELEEMGYIVKMNDLRGLLEEQYQFCV